MSRIGRKPASARLKTADEEGSIRGIFDILEFTHIDVVLANKRLDFACAAAGMLERRIGPIVNGLRLEPLCRCASRFTLVGGLVIVHELIDELFVAAVPNR